MNFNAKISVINNDENIVFNTTCKKNNDTIMYIENDELHTRTTYNYEKNVLRRRNGEYKIEYQFDLKKKTEGIIETREHKAIVSIETNKININNDNIEIEFKVEGQPILYRIEKE
ncbi:MAG: DUF1934 family protein [Bacilli bacterium]|nr:DUF1934 family protein [Bacilli bacterium]